MATKKSANHDLKPPHAGLLALEFRAPFEFGAVLPAWPALSRAPRGDGHTVLVFPGLSASDATTIPLRSYLSMLGYQSQGWAQGFNFGPRAGVLEAARNDLLEACEQSKRKVTLIGWSLGGVYARELAKEMPDMVRGVITLGTPFAGPPKSTNAWRVFELTSGRDIHHEHGNFDLAAPPKVPTTSIFSRTDGIVAWQGSIQKPSSTNPNLENIEVVASHIGLGLNPSAWWAVADRLAQEEGRWRPFDRTGMFGLKSFIYPDPERR
ncbi:triacylglycerol lipase [Caenimonas koreensis]|uniref:Alpha/beta hydrolase n=1 Tax=Caenimonas koreensis DSM 17982 TaxID=1121255 RepID=A0A844ATT4_9BURK|nr:alpha/beta hydrolase [Caenimonas koreensis]MRD45758.1 alpha/beta hydrolase [Caenimonas koreensis DSM 17982]